MLAFKRFLLLLGVALGGCATPPVEFVPVARETAYFPLADRLPQQQFIELRRLSRPDVRGYAEQARFRTGFVQAEHAFAGSKFTDRTLREFSDRSAIESWARSLQSNLQLIEVIAAERVTHERFRGDGWLLTFATSNARVHCMAGRAFFAVLAIGDDAGFTYDTTLAAFFCHPAGQSPNDLIELFRRLPAPRAA
ncbi:MAG: hypothetical protein RLZZ187_2521 [Pseudomonadota bacterium]